MIALKYEMEMARSQEDFDHGVINHVLEYYIPSEGIYFNELGKIFLGDEKRYLKGIHNLEVTLDDALVKTMKDFIELKDRLEIELSAFFQ